MDSTAFFFSRLRCRGRDRLERVDVPCLLVTRLSEDVSARPFLLGGPQISFIGGATQRFAGEELDIGEQVGDWDVALVIGAGVELGGARTRAIIEVRYSHGFINLDPFDDNEIKARSVKLLFGIGF